MLYVHIDAHSRYHRATIPGTRPFIFSNTAQGFNALQKWLKQTTNEALFYSVTPSGAYGAILLRRLRSIGAQAIGQGAVIQNREKTGPRVWVPVLTAIPEAGML